MGFELPHAGEAAYKAAARGEPLVLSNSGGTYSKALDKLRHAIVPVEPKAARAGGGLLSVLRRRAS